MGWNNNIGDWVLDLHTADAGLIAGTLYGLPSNASSDP